MLKKRDIINEWPLTQCRKTAAPCCNFSHLFAEGSTVAEHHATGTGNNGNDAQFVVADTVPPHVEFEVDQRQSNSLRPLSGESPQTLGIAEVLLRVVR